MFPGKSTDHIKALDCFYGNNNAANLTNLLSRSDRADSTSKTSSAPSKEMERPNTKAACNPTITLRVLVKKLLCRFVKKQGLILKSGRNSA